MSTKLTEQSLEKMLAGVQKKFHAQTEEVFRLQRNFQSMKEIVEKQNQKIKELQNTHNGLQIEHKLKKKELKSMQEVVDTHEDEKQQSQFYEHLLKLSQDEHAELKTMHDKLLGLFNARDADAFEKSLNAKIDKFESMIDQKEADMAAIQKDFKTMKNSFKASVEQEKALQKQMTEYKNIKNTHEEKYSDLNNLHEGIKAHHIVIKDAITKAFEAELSITKKEHAALKDMLDQLLDDFNAGDAVQFKRDMNKKIYDFEFLIDKQEKQIKDLQAKLESSNNLRENMKANHTVEKDAMTKAFEAEHSTIKKCHVALRDIHDQLLDDFNAGDAEQFKRDLSKKTGNFESLIDDQEKQIKDLQAKLGSSIKLRESIKFDYIAEKDALAKALEAEHSITKKEYAALKKTYDQLLFN